MLPGKLSKAFVNRLPDTARGDRAQLLVRDLDSKVERAPLPYADHVHLLAFACAGEELRNKRDGVLRCRQTDALRRCTAPAHQCVEALQGKHEMRPAFVIGNRMDLIDDDGAYGTEMVAALLCRQQNVERLRRGDEDVRRTPQHRLPLARKRVAGAHSRADFRAKIAALECQGLDLPQGAVQVLLYVVREGLERRNIQDLRALAELAGGSFTQQLVNCDQERRKRFAGASRSRDQRGASGHNRRPAFGLRLCRRAEARQKPLRNDRVCPAQSLGCFRQQRRGGRLSKKR